MNPEPASSEADPHASCTGNCDAAREGSAKFGLRGGIIAASLGVALSSCKSPEPDPRMTILYGPPPMMKNGAKAPEGKKAGQ